MSTEHQLVTHTKERMITAERQLIASHEQVKAAVRATQIAVYDAHVAGVENEAIGRAIGLAVPDVERIIDVEHDLRESGKRLEP